MGNIVELIDSLLPQDKIKIYFLELPDKVEGMLIEETDATGSITSFNGYDGVISSRIQFYIRVSAIGGKYKEMSKLIKDFYVIVQRKMDYEYDGVKLLYVGEFDLTAGFKDEKGNYIFSLMFPVIYKEL